MTDKPLTLADYAERIIEPRLKALEAHTGKNRRNAVAGRLRLHWSLIAG